MIPTQEHIVHNALGGISRKVWLMDAPEGHRPIRLSIFLDGEFYVNHMDVPVTLYGLQKEGAIPPMTCLFVSHVDGAARHQDLTCSVEYAEFIARDLVTWMRERQRQLHKGGHLIAGPSLGGLASAFIALRYPEVFACCLSQSGSFWWENERLTTKLDLTPPSQTRFWVSVGSKETSFGISHPPTGLRQEVAQVPACERFATALAECGHHVHYRVYEGGHEFGPWKDELPNAVQWLYA